MNCFHHFIVAIISLCSVSLLCVCVYLQASLAATQTTCATLVADAQTKFTAQHADLAQTVQKVASRQTAQAAQLEQLKSQLTHVQSTQFTQPEAAAVSNNITPMALQSAVDEALALQQPVMVDAVMTSLLPSIGAQLMTHATAMESHVAQQLQAGWALAKQPVDAVSMQVAGLTQDVSGHRSALTALRESLATLASQMTSTTNALAATQTNAQLAVCQRLDDMHTTQVATSTAVTRLDAKTEQLSTELSTLAMEHAAHGAASMVLSSQHAALSATVESLSQQQATMVQDMQQLAMQKVQQQPPQPATPCAALAAAADAMTSVAAVSAGLAEQRVALVNTQRKLQVSTTAAVAAVEAKMTAQLKDAMASLAAPLSQLGQKLENLDGDVAAAIESRLSQALPALQADVANVVGPALHAKMMAALNDANNAQHSSPAAPLDTAQVAALIEAQVQNMSVALEQRMLAGLEGRVSRKFSQIDAAVSSMQAMEEQLHSHHATMTSLEEKVARQMMSAAPASVPQSQNTATVAARTLEMQAWLKEQAHVEQQRKEVPIASA